MVIDTHIHPALFAPICEDQERFRRRCDAMNYHLMKYMLVQKQRRHSLFLKKLVRRVMLYLPISS